MSTSRTRSFAGKDVPRPADSSDGFVHSQLSSFTRVTMFGGGCKANSACEHSQATKESLRMLTLNMLGLKHLTGCLGIVSRSAHQKGIQDQASGHAARGLDRVQSMLQPNTGGMSRIEASMATANEEKHGLHILYIYIFIHTFILRNCRQH